MELLFEHFKFPHELNERRSLFSECFPETKGTSIESLNHYSWKFHSGPFNPESYEYVSKNDDGDMIGYYAAIPYPYNIQGNETPVAMVCDVMTGIKARGKGVFTQLGNYATGELGKAGVPFTMGYPIRKEVIPGHLKAGWKIAFELPLYIKFLKVNNLSFLKKIPVLPHIINAALSVISLPGKITKISYQCKVYDQTQLDKINGAELFIEKCQREFPNHLVKSNVFLTWRLGAPEKQYRIISIENEGMIRAMAITTYTVKEGVPSLAILDIMIPADSSKYRKALHIELVRLANQMKAETILVMISSTGAARLNFLQHGFFKSPFTFSLIIKNLTQQFSDEILYDPKNWNLMWIDSDDL